MKASPKLQCVVSRPSPSQTYPNYRQSGRGGTSRKEDLKEVVYAKDFPKKGNVHYLDYTDNRYLWNSSTVDPVLTDL